jgi:hypothetical protein
MKQDNYTIKRLYCKPTMKVVRLRQHLTILAVSTKVNSTNSQMNVVYEEEDI